MIKDNISRIKRRIEAVCAACKRDASAVTILAVSKGRSVEEIKEAVEGGLTDIGENKVREASLKHKELFQPRAGLSSTETIHYRPMTIKWHMVGHLQTNKVKEAVNIFDLIHSVDSLRLAQAINKQAAKINKIQDILLEINVSGEESKFGLKPDETIKMVEDIAKFKNVHIKGLMTVAPIADNPEQVRPYFSKLRDLRDKINALGIVNHESLLLSMGMTDDFEVAIEEGADIVRLGRAIFEE